MDNPNLRPPLSESLFTDRNLFQSLSQLYASKNFNRGVLLKNADFQRQNKKTYVRKSKLQSASAPSSPATYTSSPLSLKRYGLVCFCVSSHTSSSRRSSAAHTTGLFFLFLFVQKVTGAVTFIYRFGLTKRTPQTTTSLRHLILTKFNLWHRSTDELGPTRSMSSDEDIGTLTSLTKTSSSEATNSFNNININITNSSSNVGTKTDVKLTTVTQQDSSLQAIATAAAFISTTTTAVTTATINNSPASSPSLNIKRRKLDSNNSNYSNLNVNVKVDVSFDETVSGCKKTIEYDCFVLCDKCGRGTSVEEGAEGTSCAQCNGMVWKTKKRLEVDILPNGVKNGFKKVCQICFFVLLFPLLLVCSHRNIVPL